MFAAAFITPFKKLSAYVVANLGSSSPCFPPTWKKSTSQGKLSSSSIEHKVEIYSSNHQGRGLWHEKALKKQTEPGKNK